LNPNSGLLGEQVEFFVEAPLSALIRPTLSNESQGDSRSIADGVVAAWLREKDGENNKDACNRQVRASSRRQPLPDGTPITNFMLASDGL